MSLNFKQSQFELFPGSPGSSSEAGKPRYLFAHVTLSTENVVVFGIIVLMAVVFAFSWGVERGRHAAVTQLNLPHAQSRRIAGMVPHQQEAQETGKPSMPSAQNAAEHKAANGHIYPDNKSGLFQDEAAAKIPAVSPESQNLPSPSEKPFTIQVASFKSSGYAQKEAALLKKKGYDIFVMSKGQHAIVCVGRFQLEKDAKTFSSRLRNQYKDCLVRRL